MSKLSKPRPPLVLSQCLVPQHLRWLASAVIAALAGVAFWQLTWSGVALFVFCWVAVFAALPGLVGFLQPGPRHVHPIVLACIFLVVLIVTVSVALVAIASPILIGSASSLPAAASHSVRFR